jgi:hypothetical protein
MLWFACKKCGKVIGRPDSSAGALVFCDCGHGSRVPWESTAAAPKVEPQAPAQALDPIRFDPVREPAPAPSKERRPRNAPIDANSCFNHTSIDKAGVCTACGLSFCARCLTTFQNQALCTACKNYQTRILQRRPESSKLALVSFLLALAAGPIMITLVAMTRSRSSTNFLLLALLPPLFALTAGVMAMRWINRDSRRAGQHLAVSGISLAAVVGVMTTLMLLYGQKLWA